LVGFEGQHTARANRGASRFVAAEANLQVKHRGRSQSNPHASRHRCLRPARLSIPPEALTVLLHSNIRAPGNKKPGVLARQPGFRVALILLRFSGAVSPRCCRSDCFQTIALEPAARVIDGRYADVERAGLKSMQLGGCRRTDP